ncbi:cysteine-rich CWC family protein [Solimicrobium silvestre]|uniref:cysteine-rich CWC family protein n=1 Tax=Solimicrobium silvestre TaxID=2099400 RepID=UPI000CFB929E|nr:cysteine-rich CWC family protein [Solimicrobium silvestre]
MSICPRCAAQFTCAMADQTGQPCWCAALPTEPVLPIYPELSLSEDARCFCPICLQEWKKSKASSKDCNE